jgi:hypothetical protein
MYWLLLQTRVTRFGEFSAVGRLFTLGFFRHQMKPKCFCYFFTPYEICINVDKKWVGSHFGRFFHKLIRSHCWKQTINKGGTRIPSFSGDLRFVPRWPTFFSKFFFSFFFQDGRHPFCLKFFCHLFSSVSQYITMHVCPTGLPDFTWHNIS